MTIKEEIYLWFEAFEDGSIGTFHEAWKELDEIFEKEKVDEKKCKKKHKTGSN